MAMKIIAKMNSACDRDEEEIQEGRPATFKLQIRGEIIRSLMKIKLWNSLLDENLLEVMYRWSFYSSFICVGVEGNVLIFCLDGWSHLVLMNFLI